MSVLSRPRVTVVQLVLCAVAALLAAALYSNTLQHPFVYDDVRTVVDNGSIVSLRSPSTIFWFEPTRPLTNLSFAVDYAIWGLSPFGFHLTNVVLHALNVVLVFLLLLRLLQRFPIADAPASSAGATAAATLGALLFASHPVLSEAVGYISSRADLLCATGILVAVLCALSWLDSADQRMGAATWVAWVLALSAKETAIVFPLLLVMLASLPPTPAASERWRVRRLIAATTAVMVVAVLGRAFVLFRVEKVDVVGTRALLVAASAFWTYLRLLLFPAGQSIFHPVVPANGLGDIRVTVLLSVIAICGWVAWRARAKYGAVVFGTVLCASTLAPALFVGPVGNETVAEHRAYLPAVGLCIALAAMAAIATPVVQRYRSTRLLAPLACAAVVLMFSGRTYIRNLVWATPVDLWQEASTLAPGHWLPEAVLGESLHAAGRHEEAVAAFRRSLAARVDNDGALLNLVVCLSELGRSGEASAVASEYDARYPQSSTGPMARGAIAMLNGRPDDARAQFQLALARDPHSAMARQWLAVVAEQDSDIGQLLNQCYELQRLTPGRASVDACIERTRALQRTTPPAR